MFLAGDAAGFIDPFAGDGISLALQSGTLAAQSILPFLRGTISLEQAHQQYRAEYRKRFAPAFRNAARLRSALAAPKWIRNAALAFAACARSWKDAGKGNQGALIRLKIELAIRVIRMAGLEHHAQAIDII